MRPPEFAPVPLVRKRQARERNRTSPNFCKPRPQWAGRNRRPPLRFCAPEGFCPPQGVTPVMGVRGLAVLWARSARRPRPPAILWFLSHRWERNSPPAGGEIPPARNETALSSPPHPSRLRRATFPPGGRLLRGSTPHPPGEGFWGKSRPTGSAVSPGPGRTPRAGTEEAKRRRR